MNTATGLGVYVTGLAVLFGAAAGIGRIAGPTTTASASAASGTTSGHTSGHGSAAGLGGGEHGAPRATSGNAPATGPAEGSPPGGLQVAQDGFTLVPERATLPVGERSELRFRVTGPDGRPVTRYLPLHGKELHLIIARRDLSGFQHLHPVLDGAGVWSVPLTVAEVGVYRMFTDVRPESAERQLTLGTDVSAPGDYRPEALPKAKRTARIGDYTVKLSGDLVPGGSSRLTLSVSRAGRPVTDLQPYLEAYGHLVALRAGDLAYLHVHPDGAPGDGRTSPGPDITFYAEVPSAGAYRLYLDFQHEGTVRTAEFTAMAGPTPEAGASRPANPTDHDDHDHG
ncbi:hypothetical protein [Actinomadura sp. HBU206391]|uniref:hypothetical protein n=1 Tax=Actinomadura sp. HBU206391 TaxID=2731692 RepID=UPI0016509901|nr:hypothetical protein [Actinomadura sp. HBU206391]MBC6460324.1 hypothetical protein [Actinomadura sp. HBU206391]